MSKEFFQDAPELNNQYLDDLLLKKYVENVFPEDLIKKIEPDLIQFGFRVVTDILDLCNEAEAEEPRLINYDPWGNRIDEIKVSHAWEKLHDIAASEGLINIGYSREHGEYSRIYQFIKLYLYNPSSAIQTCPLAMTDAAAKIIEALDVIELKRTVFKKLISKDVTNYWTSGQWMTERSGGSDVGQTETIAKKEGKFFKLYGFKWFTSAATSEVAFTLGRIVDESGNTDSGSKGLSLFYVETKDSDNKLNSIQIERLKEKLGTKALPTAEIRLNGTIATLVGEPGRGVKNISHMLNMTRLYNSVSAVAYLRRGIALLKDYSKKRVVFGKKLTEQPLHIEMLAELEINFHAIFHLTFNVISLLGKEETEKASSREKSVIRILTPITKLYTGKIALSSITEVLEGFGGAGYIEDTGIPRLLRDMQVLTIWEGTTNVLSLDLLRALKKNSISALTSFLDNKIDPIYKDNLIISKNKLKVILSSLNEFIRELEEKDKDFAITTARNLSYKVAEVTIGALLLEFAQNNDLLKFDLIANRWIDKLSNIFTETNKMHRDHSKLIVFDDDKEISSEKFIGEQSISR